MAVSMVTPLPHIICDVASSGMQGTKHEQAWVWRNDDDADDDDDDDDADECYYLSNKMYYHISNLHLSFYVITLVQVCLPCIDYDIHSRYHPAGVVV